MAKNARVKCCVFIHGSLPFFILTLIHGQYLVTVSSTLPITEHFSDDVYKIDAKRPTLSRYDDWVPRIQLVMIFPALQQGGARPVRQLDSASFFVADSL